MNPQSLLNGCLWFLSILWVVEHVVSMTRTRAPKRTRIMRAPSIHCERNPDWRVNSLQMFQRQAD